MGVERVDHQTGPAQCRDADLGIRRGADRVVDLGHDVVDAERLGRDLGGHDVAVVAFGQGQEDVGALGARRAAARPRRCRRRGPRSPGSVDGRRSKLRLTMSRITTS